MGIWQSQPTQFSRVLQESTETRMRAIREKISLAHTFCTTVELEVRFGHVERAKELLNKLGSTVDHLTAHINDPAHVSDKAMRQTFRSSLAQIKLRVRQCWDLLNSPPAPWA